MERMMVGRKSIAILQSNYLPWKGYFDIIAAVDEFLIFDEVQYTRRDWRNRNKIIVQGTPRWLTIPVRTKGRFEERIDEIEADGGSWAERHWRTISHAYGKAEFFGEYRSALETAYSQAAGLVRLTQINELFLRTLGACLGLSTPITRTSDIPRQATNPTDRLVEICVARGATQYLSGPAAKIYIQVDRFEQAKVELRYADYSGYPVYDQHSPSFEHGVSIVDTLMRCGPGARNHLKSLNDRETFVRLP